MGLGAIAGIGSAVIGASSASKAAKAQQSAASNQVALARETRDLTREDLSPFVGAGGNALAALQFELGLGERPSFGGTPAEIQEINNSVTNRRRVFNGGGENAENNNGYRDVTTNQTRYGVGDQTFDTRDAAQDFANANPTGGTPYAGFTATPGYDFRLNEGRNALEASAAQRGGINSGSTLQALTRYGQDYATGEYNNYLNRLTGQAASGQNAAAGLASANQNFSAQAGNALAASGNAQAAGAIGVGNAIQGGINNGIGLWQYQNTLNGGGGNNSLFGNTSWGG